MESLIALFQYVAVGLGIGLGVGLILFTIRTLLIFLCKNSDLSFCKFILSILIKKEIAKIQKLGFQVFIYNPIIDHKKNSISDAIADMEVDYKNPLTLEQDHMINNVVFSKVMSLIFFRKSDLSVKGFFLDEKSRTVYTGKLIMVDADDSNNS